MKKQGVTALEIARETPKLEGLFATEISRICEMAAPGTELELTTGESHDDAVKANLGDKSHGA